MSEPTKGDPQASGPALGVDQDGKVVYPDDTGSAPPAPPPTPDFGQGRPNPPGSGSSTPPPTGTPDGQRPADVPLPPAPDPTRSR